MDEIIRISCLPDPSALIDTLSTQMDQFSKHRIDCDSWDSDFSGHAKFTIAYSIDSIFLKYYVSEENIRAIFTKPNDPVYKDSCVEFFIAFNGETDYYNFEFNCKGTCLAGYGPYKENRQLLTVDKIQKIKSLSIFNTESQKEDKMINWELMLVIPKESFTYHHFDSLENEEIKVNFYKCGDDLPSPHYLSWNPIEAEEPNFHLPQFFGKATFV